ncbi:MAG: Sb-PDE family phosphodiesterase [Bacteroidota bacterium]
MINYKTFRIKQILFALLLGTALLTGQLSMGQSPDRAIEFPDIPGYLTLKCDFHMHTVLSDGNVWHDIRVQEALKDGLDAIAITDHIEYQPHRNDIPHPDRNRSYELAKKAAKGSELTVINGVEITRDMPPGHANAIFVQDANRLNQDDVMKVFREARRQDAFVFWNHPHWTAQQRDGIAFLDTMHRELISEGLLQGVEIFNEDTYSDEAVKIALDHNLTMLGNSDIHGLIDWQFDLPGGGHRPVTLVFATENSPKAIKEALMHQRTAVWFKNTLVGSDKYLVPLIQQSIVIERHGKSLVEKLFIQNNSDADYIIENRSEYNLHNLADVFILKAHEQTLVQVKTVEKLDSYILRFAVLNAITAPGEHPEIELVIE